MGSPDKGLWFLVVLDKVLLQCGDEIRQAVEDAATQAVDSEVPEETLHYIMTRGAGRRKMEMETRVPRQPPLNHGMFVRGVVIQDKMQVSILSRLRIDKL